MKVLKTLAYITLAAVAVTTAVFVAPVAGVVTAAMAVVVISAGGALCIEGVSSIPDRRPHIEQGAIDHRQVLTKAITGTVVGGGLLNAWAVAVAELTTGVVVTTTAPAWITVVGTGVVLASFIGGMVYMLETVFTQDTNA